MCIYTHIMYEYIHIYVRICIYIHILCVTVYVCVCLFVFGPYLVMRRPYFCKHTGSI